MDHEPLKWLATIIYAHGRQGCWIDMLQDIYLKLFTTLDLNMWMFHM